MLIYPIFIPQKGCPFKCIFCDQQQFDSVEIISFETIRSQLAQFCQKHSGTKKQIAFYGGTFTGLSNSERDSYYNLVKPYLDTDTTIRISTRPDYIDPDILAWCADHSIKTIELGIQDFNDEVLIASARGYDKVQAINACLLIKQAGFELGVQLMPGLPSSSAISVTDTMECLAFIVPDFIRLYPLIILSGTALWILWEEGRYQPLELGEAIGICADYCMFAKNHGISVSKIGIPALDKDSKYIGPYHPAFGELVKGELLIRKIEAGIEPDSAIHISEKEISMLTGHKGYNLIKLLKRIRKCSVKLVPDAYLEKGEISFSNEDYDPIF